MSNPHARYGRELSPGERSIIQMIADGLGNHAIAKARGTSYHTVREQLKVIYTKLGVDNRAHAVAIALRRGMIQ